MTLETLLLHGFVEHQQVSNMDSSSLPAGYYQCPQCNNGIEVHVPLVTAPTHCCGVGKKTYTMQLVEGHNETRNRIR
jgi:hypothetical protein